jgi:hypothetical protein
MSIELRFPDDELDRLADRIAARLAGHLRPEPDDGWLDTKAAASYSGCTVDALHKAMSRREVDFEQNGPGGKAWFRRSDLDRWRAR